MSDIDNGVFAAKNFICDDSEAVALVTIDANPNGAILKQ